MWKDKAEAEAKRFKIQILWYRAAQHENIKSYDITEDAGANDIIEGTSKKVI